ncbi:aminoglycoside phosphotransferase family protein [Nonomuraea sp. K274]|uniref:Aminoglycoside phosphotransferase family protein n=1 Tax=Nonomuraea cypriaca TaxID=1187855 RepID=A0A931EWU2_9ACTN|nr:aminoglycoside phosphotransferase family protein [Nonomuraea cypriaca]MBF8185570.1 aminoglycoside phosphotransferase family protein [Nonomuraea cypriaca]
MPLEPRFRRVAALHRRFVDREAAFEAFSEEHSKVGRGPRILNVTGVGGIGKSRLLREFGGRVKDTHRVATLDLQVPAHRHQEDALAVLRVQLGERGVRFDQYDIAYAVLWQRLHPHLGLTRAELPFIEHSEVLSELLDTAAGVPVFGTAVSLLKLMDKGNATRKRRRHLQQNETLRQLDLLPGAELVDAVTYMFAEDLRAGSEGKPYVLFVDAYEASGRADGSDVWLRDLAAQLDRGLTVIASREALGWEVYDADWREVIREFPIEGLPMEARMELLSDGGVSDPVQREVIAQASVGLPFYLHLATDSRGSGHVVSQDEIAQRFLEHVSAEERRYLQLLSVARTFDYDLFHGLAAAFQLPGGRLAWEGLTAYSFVYPAAGGGFQLHRLMADMLRGRLSPAMADDAHSALYLLWSERATDAVGMREAAYHGLYAGAISDGDLLVYADRITACGGTQGVAGLISDLQDHLGGGGDPALEEAAACLAAEAAVLLGDSDRINELTPDASWRLDTEAGARLAVAAGHGRRIAGQTTRALRIYSDVLDVHTGPARWPAGLWAADLHMAQGRFRRAFELVEQVTRECPEDAGVLRGDLARLLHLALRFSYDFTAADRQLQEAARHYQKAGTIVGEALITTNRAELLAWTDPFAAVAVARKAVEANTDLGAIHEVGKAYSALGQAFLTLGRLDEAADALDSACVALEKARYRSGRARAELLRACLHARCQEPDQAAASARWAVDELVDAEVYPTLIVVADRLLAAVNRRDERVSTAARQAWAAIEPIDSRDALEDRMTHYLRGLLG